jgi:hypothetical protein
MRWMHSVGRVRWRRIHPDLEENFSGGVELVRWRRFGLWDETWDFLNENHLVRARLGGPTSTISDWRIALRN